MLAWFAERAVQLLTRVRGTAPGGEAVVTGVGVSDPRRAPCRTAAQPEKFSPIRCGQREGTAAAERRSPAEPRSELQTLL